MAASFFFPRPITTTGDLEDLYNTYGVDRAVKSELASPLETPETVRDGYCRAYLAYFQSCGLSFPIPESVLEIFAELGLSFTQACPNLLRHLVALLVRAREEGISFGLDELRHLISIKKNKQSSGTFLASPRPGVMLLRRSLIETSYGANDFSFSRSIKRPWVASTTPSFRDLGLEK